MSSRDEEKKIIAVMIIEVMGRPESYLTEMLEDLIKHIGEEPHVKLVRKEINEPKLVKDEKDLFTSFAEAEIETEDLMTIIGLTFKYMPSHVEIVEPEKMNVKNHELSEVITEITRRMHRYEELVKGMQFQLENMQKFKIESAIGGLKDKLQGKENPDNKDPEEKSEEKTKEA